MDKVTHVFNLILSPGPIVFMPVIIFLLILVLKLFSKKAMSWFEATSSAITLGIAFVAMFLVIGFMLQIFEKPFRHIRKVFNFDTIDLGWSPMSALAWAWQWAFLLFPIQIAINALMLKLRWTKTLNADMWNVWNKVLTALVMTYFLSVAMPTSAAVVIAMLTSVVWIALELKNGDVMYERQMGITGIPGVVSPHSMFFAGSMIYFIDKLLRKWHFFQDRTTTQTIVEKKWMLVLRDNMFIGFILGLILMLATMWFDLDQWATYLQLPFNLAAALVLFPMVSKLFTKSLVPFGMSIQNIMTSKFQGRELYIGLDWPFLAGNSKLWIAATALIPFEICLAIIMSYIPDIHMLFPLASLINVCLAPALLVMCNANLRRMIVAGIIVLPVYLFFGGIAAPAMTAIAKENINQLPQAAQDAIIKDNLFISNSGFEAPLIRTGLSAGVQFMTGDINVISTIGLGALIGWPILFAYYYRAMKKESDQQRKARFAVLKKPLPVELTPVGAQLMRKIFNRHD